MKTNVLDLIMILIVSLFNYFCILEYLLSKCEL